MSIYRVVAAVNAYPVPGYQDNYVVTRYGEIGRLIEYAGEYVVIRLLKKSNKANSGYLWCHLSKHGVVRSFAASNICYAAYNHLPMDVVKRLQIRHRNGDLADDSFHNLIQTVRSSLRLSEFDLYRDDGRALMYLGRGDFNKIAIDTGLSGSQVMDSVLYGRKRRDGYVIRLAQQYKDVLSRMIEEGVVS